MAARRDPDRRPWRRFGHAMLDASWYIAYPATMLGPVLPPEFRSPAAALDSLADGPAARASHPDDRTR